MKEQLWVSRGFAMIVQVAAGRLDPQQRTCLSSLMLTLTLARPLSSCIVGKATEGSGQTQGRPPTASYQSSVSLYVPG